MRWTKTSDGRRVGSDDYEYPDMDGWVVVSADMFTVALRREPFDGVVRVFDSDTDVAGSAKMSVFEFDAELVVESTTDRFVGKIVVSTSSGFGYRWRVASHDPARREYQIEPVDRQASARTATRVPEDWLRDQRNWRVVS